MTEFDLSQFAKTAERIRKKAAEEGRLMHNPPDEELERIVEREPGVRRTIYGNMVARSEPTSRAAMFTRNSVDNAFGKEEQELLAQCEGYWPPRS